MFMTLRKFKNDESGAVTVDWVVLTAAIIGLAVTAWIATRDGTMALADKVQNGIEAVSVNP